MDEGKRAAVHTAAAIEAFPSGLFMTNTPTASATAGVDDQTLAKCHCEGRSLFVDARTIASEMLPGYTPQYVRALLNDEAAPEPVQVSNSGAFLYVRLEVALFLLRRGRVTAANRRARTAAATAKRLRDYARPGGGRRLRAAAQRQGVTA